MRNDRKPLVRLTAKDFRIEWFNGSGGGGQHKNKHANCCRIHHDASGTVAVGQDQRDRPSNQKAAFQRLTNDPAFKNWLKIESMKAMGKDVRTVDEVVEAQMKEAIVEVKDENGNWVKERT